MNDTNITATYNKTIELTLFSGYYNATWDSTQVIDGSYKIAVKANDTYVDFMKRKKV